MPGNYRVGIIGAGKPWKSEGATGFGMAHGHVRGYLSTRRCELVAVTDIRHHLAEAFAKKYGGGAVYTDYHEMLANEKLDLVSVCTWPHLHAPMVRTAATRNVKGIWCEKPMAPTWGESKRMHEACESHRVTLIFNHQRRFLSPFRKAKAFLASGAIGPLRRMEAQCDNIYDWGTHWLDMMQMFNDETPAEWVIGQIDFRMPVRIFGVDIENQAIACIKYANDVRGAITTGFEANIGCAIRLIGDDGIIEIGWQDPWLRIRGKGDPNWLTIPTDEGIHDNVGMDRAAADLVQSLDTGDRPLLSSHNALKATEILFAVYESSRRRGRVDLPLEQEDSALLAMIEERSTVSEPSEP